MKKKCLDNEHEQRMIEYLWLSYFNRYLLEHETISESEYKKITEKIATRTAKIYS